MKPAIQVGRAPAAPRSVGGFVWPLVALFFLWICLNGTATAQVRKPTEYEVKAAYLYNFGRFVKWPPAPGENTFSICIYGSDPFGASLDSLVAGESIEGKRISVQRIFSSRDATSCRILFISSSTSAGALANVLSALRNAPILTVSDIPGFIDHGGMIQFVMQGERVRFHVNLGPAERSGLNFSSELLKVALSVKRDGQVGD